MAVMGMEPCSSITVMCSIKVGDIDGAVKYWIMARDKHDESPELDKKIAETEII